MPQGLEIRQCVAVHEEFEHFIKQSRRRNVGQQWRQFPEGLFGGRFDTKTQLGGKPDRPQHAHRVLAITRDGIADQTQQARVDVLNAIDMIDHREIGDVVVECVDGEVTAKGVFFQAAVDIVADNAPFRIHMALPAARFILRVQCAESRHFNDLPAEHHMRETEAAADQPAITEQATYILRARIGGNIEILRLAPEQQIAHTTANQMGLIARILQAVQHLQRIGADIAPGNRVL